ncbi:MAG: amino acid ABC transporter ATP-binding protein [Variovorax sp.]
MTEGRTALPDEEAMRPMIELTNLHKAFGDNCVLKGVSMAVRRGSVTSLIGPSGSGKSTLLRCCNLLEIPDAGELRLGEKTFRFDRAQRPPSDRQLAAYRAETGMVFQHFNLFPHMSVLQNVIEGPLTVRGMRLAEAQAIGRTQLEKVGLLDKQAEYPNRLSGGQKQRVAIARALAMNPEVLLLDEVTSALDPELVDEVLGVIRQLVRDGMTMIIVTHEMAFARNVCDQVIFMSDGVVVESGSASKIFDGAQQDRTQQFLARYTRTMQNEGRV